MFLGVWIAAAWILAPVLAALVRGRPFAVNPTIPVLAVGFVIGTIVAVRRSPSLHRTIAAVPVATLHVLQSWRVLGVVFIVLMVQGQLPAHFALPAGWGDIFVGVTAPLVALLLVRGGRGARTTAVLWNAFGLFDLVVAVGMGTGTLAPLVLGTRVPPAAAMGMHPMILVPAFAVPASGIVHVLALARLRRAPRRIRQGDDAPAAIGSGRREAAG